ncbi:MAG: prepilin-type N-terminal cleavage/methylation domain-containing protein [Chthoniobacterales bacterium]
MKYPQLTKRPSLAGFTLVEVCVSAAVLGIFSIGLFASITRGFSVIRSSRNDSAAALALEKRMDQFSRAVWTDVTCNYPPLEEGDPEDPPDGAEVDPDAVYSTEYGDELGDLDTAPGVVRILAVPCDALNNLDGVEEKITIVPYPDAGAKFITGTRSGTTITTSLSSGDDDYRFITQEKAVKVTARISWQSGGQTKSIATQTIVAKGS